MYSSTYVLDNISDEEISSQQAIQESLQDRFKMETSGSSTENGR